MTKAFLRSQLHGLLAAVDKVGKYHDTFLDHVLETCLNSVYFQAHEKNPMALGQYTKRYRLQTAAAGDVDRWEYALPVKLVPLPDKRGGVRNIRFESDYSIYAFVPVTDQEMVLLQWSQARSLTTATPAIIYFSVMTDKIEFVYQSAAPLLSNTLQVDLLVAFTSLVDTDEVPLPYGKNTEIMKMALEMIGVIPPKDLLDNNSDTR